VACGALIVGSGSAGAATPAHGKPVVRTVPSAAPQASERNGACVVDGRDDSASPPQDAKAPLMWVRAEPTSLVAVWLPGSNAKKCVARRTLSGATVAGRVATAIRQAGAFPDGALPCPNADGAAVEVYLRYADRPAEYAVVTLSGCRAVGAPQRHARWSTTKLQHALAKAAPKAWTSYFVG
jgi:hypothetical protein